MKTKTLFLIAFICLSSYSLFSQERGRIIYTDFEDDVFLPLYDSISIDINHDNILDCKVVHNWTDTGLHYQSLNTNVNWEITSVYPNDSLPIMNHTNWDTTGFITMCWMGVEWMGEIKDFNFILLDASSIKSIALSGKNLSCIYFSDISTVFLITSLEILTL